MKIRGRSEGGGGPQVHLHAQSAVLCFVRCSLVCKFIRIRLWMFGVHDWPPLRSADEAMFGVTAQPSHASSGSLVRRSVRQLFGSWCRSVQVNVPRPRRCSRSATSQHRDLGVRGRLCIDPCNVPCVARRNTGHNCAEPSDTAVPSGQVKPRGAERTGGSLCDAPVPTSVAVCSCLAPTERKQRGV